MSTDAPVLSQADADSFRARCREFLDAEATGLTIIGEDPRSDQSIAQSKVFQAKVAAANLAGLTYDTKFGGQGLTSAHDRIWREEYAKSPDMTGQLTISHGMCVPVLNEFGTDEQRAQFMPDAIAARTIWCQMFSEPGAGSDVASLQTKAELDGDEWTINGQKVWTTLAHQCDYGILIARTDPEQPKHRGISMFIVDMKDPAVEIRPINQIDGGVHFNEVFFTDLRIPKDWLVGTLNDGWRLATAMLMYERVAIGTGSTSGIKTPNYKWLSGEATKRGVSADPVIRQMLAKLYSEEATKSLVAMRTRAELKAGKAPGPGGSLGKLHGAGIARMTRSMIAEIAGPSALAWEQGNGEDHAEKYMKGILGSFSANIAGGTDEIQKNIIGDRVLGLPREPSVDKDVAFNSLKVGTQRTD